MPLADAQEGDASGSRKTRSGARWRPGRRSSESLESESTALHFRRLRGSKRAKRASSTAAPVIVTTTHSMAAGPWLRSTKGMRSDAAAKERPEGSKRRKRNRADRCKDEEGWEAKKRNLGPEARDEEEEVSSAPSSPLCVPYIPQEVIGRDCNGLEIYKPIDSETLRAYRQRAAKYDEKTARIMKLPTLDSTVSSKGPDDLELLQVHESAATETVLRAGKFVLGLSSSVGGKPLAQCTGFLIDWDQKDKRGTILTSAHLIISKASLDSWLCKDEYVPNAQVIIHLPDKTTADGKLCYYHKHYNLALFSIKKVNLPVHLPLYDDTVKHGQEVFMLGRNENSNIRITYGRVQYLNPNLYERYHLLYTSGAGADPQCGTGGPVLDFDGKVVGMSTPDREGSFVPSSIILKWLHLWRKYGCVPRPHLGLKFCAIKFLKPAHVERILLDCGIDGGLIVQEVSNGSCAEKHGIRVGDVVECLNGEHNSSPLELDNMLLRLVEQHLDRGNHNDSKMDVEVGIFRTRKGVRRVIKMTLNVTEEGEVVVEGSYPVTIGEGVSALVSPEQLDPGSYRLEKA
ncbi:uncharacterized protein LOC133904813 [Phragmites australis]|uniref:uncharacterized protein LOC133904813 n=1 Tax=Phragmites australis TaxID=29695 RepID=UPI002D7A188B|nr:uncharacterized protein LOC133904813 [Phragmites australis]